MGGLDNFLRERLYYFPQLGSQLGAYLCPFLRKRQEKPGIHSSYFSLSLFQGGFIIFKEHDGEEEMWRKRTDVGVDLNSSIMKQQADIWCNSLDSY